MIDTIEIERFSHPDMVAFAKRTDSALTFAEFESVVREGLGKAGLMLFMEVDQGSVIRKATGRDTPGMVRLIMGNPLIMQQMARHVPDAGSYAPVTVLVDEDAVVALRNRCRAPTAG